MTYFTGFNRQFLLKTIGILLVTVFAYSIGATISIKDVEKQFAVEKKLTTVSQTFITKENSTIIETGNEYWQSFGLVYKLPRSEDKLVADWIKKHINELPTLFIFELSRRTYPVNREEALKWFAIARIRLQYDSKRCTGQPAVDKIVYDLRDLYREVALYTHEHQAEYFTAIKDGVEWDKTQNIQTSPMWICAKSLKAVRYADNKPAPVASTELTASKSDWANIRTQNYTDTLAVWEKLQKKAQ